MEGFNKEPACAACGDFGSVRVDLPVGDPGFGKLHPCMECYLIRHPRQRTFADFLPLHGAEEALQAAREWAEDEGPDWLVLVGDVGTGKTHLAQAARFRLLERLSGKTDVRRAVKFWGVGRLLENAWENLDDPWTARPVEQEAGDARWLLLDHLWGRERVANMEDVSASETIPLACKEMMALLHRRYEEGLRTMMTLIYRRYGKGLRTLITTIHDREGVEAMFGAGVASRLFDAETDRVRVVRMTARSYRQYGPEGDTAL